MNSAALPCELCANPGGVVVWDSPACRVIRSAHAWGAVHRDGLLQRRSASDEDLAQALSHELATVEH